MKNKITFTVYEGEEDNDNDVAYITLPEHLGKGTSGAVSKQIRLLDLATYVSPDIYLGFDSKNHLISLEIIA